MVLLSDICLKFCLFSVGIITKSYTSTILIDKRSYFLFNRKINKFVLINWSSSNTVFVCLKKLSQIDESTIDVKKMYGHFKTFGGDAHWLRYSLGTIQKTSWGVQLLCSRFGPKIFECEGLEFVMKSTSFTTLGFVTFTIHFIIISWYIKSTASAYISISFLY